MIALNPLSTAGSSAAVSASTAREGTTTNLPEMGKTQFLQLLVTQLQHQDPLSPLQNDQFVAQLATFSSLEQLMDINEAVTKLSEQKTEVPNI